MIKFVAPENKIVHPPRKVTDEVTDGVTDGVTDKERRITDLIQLL